MTQSIRLESFPLGVPYHTLSRAPGTKGVNTSVFPGVAILEAIDVVAFIVLVFEVLVGICALGVTGTLLSALEATQGQNDSFFSQLSYKCYLEAVASVGD